MKVDFDESVPDYWHDVLERLSTFFGIVLLPPDINEYVTLDISFNESIPGEAQCVNEDRGRNPRWFSIDLNPQYNHKFVAAMAHEMVHVKQYATNELRCNLVERNGGETFIESKWHGKVWTPGRFENAYYDAPWEIEAFGRERGLVHRWKDWCGMKGIPELPSPPGFSLTDIV